MFLMSDGSVYACGSGSQGALGDGKKMNRYKPVRVKMPSGVLVSDICAGWMHSMAITSDGECYVWGSGSYHQLGLGSEFDVPSPARLELGGETVSHMSGGIFHSAAVTASGNVYVWGRASPQGNQLGVKGAKAFPHPHKISLKNVQKVYCGLQHTLFLSKEGTVFSCGNNIDGALGVADMQVQEEPVEVRGLQGRVLECSVGPSHNFAILEGGKLVFWGKGSDHQSGSEERSTFYSPTLVSSASLLHVEKVSTGFSHCLLMVRETD